MHAPEHPDCAAHCSILRTLSAQHAWTRAPQQVTRTHICKPPKGESAEGLAHPTALAPRRGSNSIEPWTPSTANP